MSCVLTVVISQMYMCDDYDSHINDTERYHKYDKLSYVCTLVLIFFLPPFLSPYPPPLSLLISPSLSFSPSLFPSLSVSECQSECQRCTADLQAGVGTVCLWCKVPRTLLLGDSCVTQCAARQYQGHGACKSKPTDPGAVSYTHTHTHTSPVLSSP